MCTLHIRKSTSSANHQISLSSSLMTTSWEINSLLDKKLTWNSQTNKQTGIFYRVFYKQTYAQWSVYKTNNRKMIDEITWDSDNPSRRTAMMASAMVSGLQVLKGPRSRKRKFCMTPCPVAQAFCHNACNWYWYVSTANQSHFSAVNIFPMQFYDFSTTSNEKPETSKHITYKHEMK